MDVHVDDSAVNVSQPFAKPVEGIRSIHIVHREAPLRPFKVGKISGSSGVCSGQKGVPG
jgi:hypothetical protein